MQRRLDRRAARLATWTITMLGAAALGAPRAQAQNTDAGVAVEGNMVPDASVPTTNAPPATGAPDGGTAADRAQEEAEIAAQLAAMRGAENPAALPFPVLDASPAMGASASSRGLSNAMNPAISGNGLLLGGWSSRDEGDAVEDRGDLETGPQIQEIEVVLSAIVDPYFRADVVVAGSPTEDEIGFEEAYVTTLELPQLAIRAGLFKAALGRHNLLHTHAYPFLTGPMPWRAQLGPEGLADAGLSFDVLLPLPFYAEVNVQAFAGEWTPFEGGTEDDPTTAADESVPDLRNPEDLAYVDHLKTLFDLSDATTIEIGGSYLGGRNGWGELTNIVGGNVTLKWRPVDAERYQSFEWQNEWLWIDRGQAPGERPAGGAYTHVRCQFDQRWWIQARGSLFGLPRGSDARVMRGEGLVAFVPSEFSALRLQYGIERAGVPGAPFVHDVFLQMVFSIGPHPVHAY